MTVNTAPSTSDNASISSPSTGVFKSDAIRNLLAAQNLTLPNTDIFPVPPKPSLPNESASTSSLPTGTKANPPLVDRAPPAIPIKKLRLMMLRKNRKPPQRLLHVIGQKSVQKKILLFDNDEMTDVKQEEVSDEFCSE